MLRIGLTGGIGSGKSTVAELLARHGATLVDTDAISRSLTQPGGAAIAALAAEFGPNIISARAHWTATACANSCSPTQARSAGSRPSCTR